MNNLNIKNILYLILGLFIISWTFWHKFLRIRLPKTFAYFNNSYATFIVIITILILLITILTILWDKLTLKKNTSGGIIDYLLRFNIIKNILEYLVIFRESLNQAPKTVYERLIFEHYNVSHILEVPFFTISSFIKELPIKYAYILTLIHIIFHTIPKIIPPIIFLIEVCFFQEINYFYKSIIFYIIPLIYNILNWILGHLADHNTYFITAHIDITYHAKDDFSAVFQKEIPPIEGAVDIISRKYDQKLLEWFFDAYQIYLDIKWLVYRLDLEKQ